MIKDSTAESPTIWFTLILVALYVVINILELHGFWGLSPPASLGTPWLFIPILFTVALSIPAVYRLVRKTLDKVPDANAVTVGAMTGFLFCLLGLALRESIPLLGDGSLRANEIFDGQYLQPTEFLDFGLHAIAFNGIFAPLGYSATDTYRALSSLAAIPFTLGVVLLARQIFPGRWIMAALILLSSSLIVFFFGYIESYSLVAAIVPFTIWYGIRYTLGGGGDSRFFCYCTSLPA